MQTLSIHVCKHTRTHIVGWVDEHATHTIVVWIHNFPLCALFVHSPQFRCVNIWSENILCNFGVLQPLLRSTQAGSSATLAQADEGHTN